MYETLESVFESLPPGCTLKNPNSYSSKYQAAYREMSKNAVKVHGDTAKEAVIKLAELLALNTTN